MVLSNRFLALFVIWTTALLITRYKQFEEDKENRLALLSGTLESTEDGILIIDTGSRG